MHVDWAIYDEDISAFDIWDTLVGPEKIPTLPRMAFEGIDQSKQPLTMQSCTIAGSVNQVHRLWGMNPTNDLLVMYVEYARDKYGYKPWSGWMTRLWVNSTRSCWNENNADKQVFTQSWEIWDEVFWDALKKWHLIGVTYRGNATYNKDFYSDGVLDAVTFGKPSYGHRPNVFEGILEYVSDDSVRVYDNYNKKIKYNVYKLTDLIGLVKSGVFYPWYYLFLPTSILTEDPVLIAKKKTERKALDHLLYAMSSTYDSIEDTKIHTALHMCADAIRSYIWETTDTSTQKKKAMQSTVNALSFWWNFFDDREIQDIIGKLAKTIREKYSLK